MFLLFDSLWIVVIMVWVFPLAKIGLLAEEGETDKVQTQFGSSPELFDSFDSMMRESFETRKTVIAIPKFRELITPNIIIALNKSQEQNLRTIFEYDNIRC